jgi:O-antigen/teichoic acid export membrane protein
MSLARSAIWVMLSEIIFNLSGYIIHSVVGRILGPSDYGRFALVITLTTMVIILIGRGIPTAMTKYLSEVFEKNPAMVLPIKRKAALLQFFLMGGITALFFFCAPLIAWALGDSTLTPLFRLSSLIIPAFALTSFYVQYFIGLHEFNIQSILKTFRSLTRIVFVITLAYFFSVGGSVSGYILSPLFVSFLAIFIDQIWITKKYPSEPQNTFAAKKLLNYAWQIVIFFLAYELLISIDLYLVKGILRNDHLTGIYNSALTIGRIPYYLFSALTIMILPIISKSTAEENQEKTGQIISQSLRLMLILLAPIVVIMSYFSAPLIEFFYSAKYLEAAYPMSILVYGVGFLTIFYVLSFIMNGAGKTKIPMIISILGVALNTLLNYILIKKYALVGSAWAISITSFIAMLIMLFYLYREFKVTIHLKSFLKILLASIILYFSCQFFSQEAAIFILWSFLLFILYLAVLYLLREITKEDWNYVLAIVKRKKSAEIEPSLDN